MFVVLITTTFFSKQGTECRNYTDTKTKPLVNGKTITYESADVICVLFRRFCGRNNALNLVLDVGLRNFQLSFYLQFTFMQSLKRINLRGNVGCVNHKIIPPLRYCLRTIVPSYEQAAELPKLYVYGKKESVRALRR